MSIHQTNQNLEPKIPLDKLNKKLGRTTRDWRIDQVFKEAGVDRI
jgi:hypothetical protein